MKGPKRESKVEKHLRLEIEKLGGWCAKWVSPGNSGVTDRIIFLLNGAVYFVETKTKGEEPSALQDYQHRRLRKYKRDVRVLDTIEKIDHFILEICL